MSEDSNKNLGAFAPPKATIKRIKGLTVEDQKLQSWTNDEEALRKDYLTILVTLETSANVQRTMWLGDVIY